MTKQHVVDRRHVVAKQHVVARRHVEQLEEELLEKEWPLEDVK